MISHYFVRLDTVLKQYATYFPPKGGVRNVYTGIFDFDFISYTLTGGTGTANDTPYTGILVDDVISETEIRYLEILRDDISLIVSAMESPDNPPNENQNLTVLQMDNILKTFFDKWSFHNEESPYFLLRTSQTIDARYEVSVERIDKSVLTDEGETLAYIYFDKPVASGNSSAVKKINAYFEKACNQWLAEDKTSEEPTIDTQFLENFTALDEFLGILDDYRERFNDDYILQPGYSLKHILYSKVILSDPETLSIMHVSDWYAGGVRNFRIYGSTFDMITGELRQCPFDLDDPALKEQLISIFPENTVMEITDKYYRDKDYVYIIIQGRDDYVIKWNGKIKEDFEAEWLEWDWINELPD